MAKTKYQKLAKRHDGDVVSLIEKLKFYDVTWDEHIPVCTVCLALGENGTVLARGVSICSPVDGINRKKGRNMALGRAIQAIHRSESLDPIRPDIRDAEEYVVKKIKVKTETGFEKQIIRVQKYLPVFVASKQFAYKAELAPDLTDHEKQLLGV